MGTLDHRNLTLFLSMPTGLGHFGQNFTSSAHQCFGYFFPQSLKCTKMIKTERFTKPRQTAQNTIQVLGRLGAILKESGSNVNRYELLETTPQYDPRMYCHKNNMCLDVSCRTHNILVVQADSHNCPTSQAQPSNLRCCGSAVCSKLLWCLQ